MSNRLTYVPTTRPIQPNMMSPMSLISMYLRGPKLSGQRTQISIIPGKAIPKADRHRAPKREINKPSRGTAIAKTTVNYKNNYRWEMVIYMYILFFLFLFLLYEM
jgi:hypothetical protein